MSASRPLAGARLLVGLLLPMSVGAVPLRAQSSRPDSAPATQARVARERSAHRGATVAVIDLDEVDLTTVRTLSDLLASRVPGAVVRRTNGAAGAGASVLLRGPIATDDTSFLSRSRAHEPLLVVDGVRADGSQSSLALRGYAVAPSRLDDFRLEDLATVEVLRGPAAAALYGDGSESGVIVLTTRAGRSSGPRAGVFASATAVTTGSSYAARYGRADATTGEWGCTLTLAADGGCVPDRLVRGGALEGASVYESGTATTVGGFTQGRVADRVGYYVGGALDDRPGLRRANDARRGGVQSRLDATVIEGLELRVSGGYLRGNSRLDFPSSSPWDPLAEALTRPANVDTMADAPVAVPPEFAVRQELARTTGSASLSFTPVHWLTSSVTYGADDWHTSERAGDVVFEPGSYDQRSGSARLRSGTAGGRATVSYAPTPSLSAATTFGVERTTRLSRDSASYRYVRDQLGVSTGAQWWRLHTALSSIFVAQHLAWSERLLVDVGLRRDRLRYVGVGYTADPALQRSAEVSWSFGESAGARSLWSDGARLRAAYGRVTRASSPFVEPANRAYPFPADPSAEQSDPERTREVEVGIDASYLGGRLDLTVTAYDKLTSDGEVPSDPFFGAPELRRGGALDVRNRGLELRADGGLYRGKRLRWDATLTFAANRNRVTRLVVPPVLLYTPIGGGNFVKEGQPLSVFVGSPVVGYEDRNGDGVIHGCAYRPYDPIDPACELEFRTTESYGGTPYPTREASLSSSLALGSRLTLSGQLDYRGGAKLYNATRFIRCLYGNCREQYDPGASLAEQAEVGVVNSVTPYLEDAGFVKLREVALALRVPERWVRSAGTLTLTAAVRNAATWTRYSGADPEVSASANPLLGTDLFVQTQPRLFVLRAEIER